MGENMRDLAKKYQASREKFDPGSPHPFSHSSLVFHHISKESLFSFNFFSGHMSGLAAETYGLNLRVLTDETEFG